MPCRQRLSLFGQNRRAAENRLRRVCRQGVIKAEQARDRMPQPGFRQTLLDRARASAHDEGLIGHQQHPVRLNGVRPMDRLRIAV